MIGLFNYAEDYLRGNSMYSPVSRFLNLTLSVAITSFVFRKVYFDYSLLDIIDYKGMCLFFVNGNFAVPLILFTILHYGIDFLAGSVFSLATLHFTSKWIDRINSFKIKKRDFSIFKVINRNPVIPVPAKFDKGVILKYYEPLKNSIPQEEWEKAKKVFEKKKKEISRNFRLALKGMVTLTVFLISVPYLGLLLYFITMGLLLTSLGFFIYTFVILEVTPVLLRKLDSEIAKQVSA